MFEKLKEIMCEYIEADSESITPESKFSSDLGFNSYNFISMLGDLEDEFDVEIEEKKAIKMKTPQELMDYLEELK